MGPSADRRPGPDGETNVYYPRLPYGGEVYVARIGPDGKLKALEQRLSEKYVAMAKPGTSRKDDMRALFGPPHQIQQFPRMSREIWEYPWRGETSPRLLLLQFSPDGVLREIYSIEDPNGVSMGES